jgi:hypothetical protein
MVSILLNCAVTPKYPERLGAGEPVGDGGERVHPRRSNINGGLIATHNHDTALIWDLL